MKNISFRKLTLSILALIIIGVGLTGCLVPDITVTGTAKLIVSGNYYYDIKMDGIPQWDSEPSGTYTLIHIPVGNHKFEAIDARGASWGYDSKTVYIAAGTTTTVNLNPKQTATTGTAKLIVSGNYYYDIKMDGYIYFSDRLSGTFTLTDIPIGNHKFEAIDVDGASFGYDSKTVYIAAGTTTTVNLNPTSSVSTGSLQVNIMDDPNYKYYVYLGASSSGLYLGTTTGGSIYNTFTAHNISTGNQNIYVISIDGFYDKTISTYVNPNMTNVLNIWVK